MLELTVLASDSKNMFISGLNLKGAFEIMSEDPIITLDGLYGLGHSGSALVHGE